MFNEEQIYKVTFGMKYETNNRQKFIDKLKVKINGKDCFIKLPVYAMIKEGKIIEIVTGNEIPLAENRVEPGFGVYMIEPLYTYEDYRNLRENLTWISTSIINYKKAFSMVIRELEEETYAYRYSHYDDYGRLTSNIEERKEKYKKMHEENIMKSYELIRKINNK